MKKTVIMTSAVLVSLGLTGCGSEYKTPENKVMKNMSNHNDMENHDNKMGMEDVKIMDSKKVEKIDLAGYTDFSQEKIETLKGKQKFAVFFYADWCGTCKGWEKKLKENLATLPENTLILKANYDEEKDLVKALHVKSQSSLVLFNKNGEIIDNLIDPSMEKVQTFFADTSADNITKSGDKYEVYTEELYKSLEGKQKFVVFFYADWCGTCRAWEKKFMAALDIFPVNTKILKANYDNDTLLRSKFGIKMQSVAAFVNADGTLSETVADPSMEKVKSFFQ